MDCRLKQNQYKRVCLRKVKDYPLKSTTTQLSKAVYLGNAKIKNAVSKKEWNILKDIVEKSSKLQDTFAEKRNKDGSLRKIHAVYHRKILNNQFRRTPSDYEDPDLYIFGGLPGSGKSEVLRKLVPEKTIKIDSDDYKKLIAKKSKSPIRRFELAHAGLLHREADVLVENAIKRAIKTKKNVTLDMTFGSLEKGKKIIKDFRKEGYEVHFLGTQKYPHNTIVHIASRFIKHGRFVPLDYVKEKGNKISENSWKARKFADDYRVYDTSLKRHPVLITKSKNMKLELRSPKF